MHLNVYQAQASSAINKNLSRREIQAHALQGMTIFCGALHYYHQETHQEDHIKIELGNLLWCVAECCYANGWMLEDIAKLNINKLKERKETNVRT